MEHQSVTSSMIRSIGYNMESSTLEIDFLKGGLYNYADVPQGVYDALMGAESHGKYFLANIKNTYSTSKL
jgi:hypothetical protein